MNLFGPWLLFAGSFKITHCFATSDLCSDCLFLISSVSLWYWLLFLTFRFLFFWVLTFFLSLSLTKAYQFCVSFRRLISWLLNLFYWVLVSILLISSLIFVSYYFMLTLGFVLFLIPLANRLSCLRIFFFLEVGLYCCQLPSLTSFVASHRFWKVVFLFSYFLRYFLISSLIHWLFSRMLFIPHMFVFFLFFFL